ncbi:hypothetical protein I350_02521 [Cryptococcus amylolentus CBS 6273]|uniref:Pre-mRNA-splicing factor CWC24 n=1 Tax=Cryptococcus amylolentus CBS 6273 TaxID=1296118 RepID=A0A1E3KDD0_9TREE|nr:hypothetical protein I350_02521 [Cryptococcus amylolentus CBS 6273]
MPNVQFKKGPSRRPAQSRKRSPTPPDADEPSSVVRTQTKSIANPLVQGTKRRRDVQAGDNVADDENGLDEFGYRADEGLTKRADELVTRANDWDLENEPVPEKKVRLNEDGDIDDGIYRGASNYLPTINKTRETLDKKMKSGPIKATSHVRTITLMDYQPDVCKDYKETGFCGYGDSCKFMHDRGDYLAGWQLDKMAEEGGGRAQVEEEDEDEEVPCATKRFQKSPKCYACGAATQGIFNTAEKIIAKIEARNKVRQEERDERKGQENDGGGIIFGGGDAASDASDDDE